MFNHIRDGLKPPALSGWFPPPPLSSADGTSTPANVEDGGTYAVLRG